MKKLYNEYAISPIKGLKEKYTNSILEDLLYEINDELYFFANLPVNNISRIYLLERVNDIGSKIKDLSVTFNGESVGNKRREEILFRLREMYKILNTPFIEPTEELIEKMCKYQSALYLKEKKIGLTAKDALDWLYKIFRLSKFYKLNSTLKSIQEEIINYFKVY